MRKLIGKAPKKKVLDYTVRDMLAPTVPTKEIVLARGLMLAYYATAATLGYLSARLAR